VVSVSIHPVLACGHETLLEGPEEQGARRGGPRNEQGGGGEDLLGLGADHQALARAPPRDRRGRCHAHPRPSPREGGGARRVAARAPARENPDLTLEEHREAFEEQSGIAVSASTVGREIARLPGGWPLKKSPR
jgi:hypothetical protein